MPSLKEIKTRIGTVSTTLKTTSAMKMISSSKLRKAQELIGNMLPYQERLHDTLVNLMGGGSCQSVYMTPRPVCSVALVCFASNSSLCGGFNSNAIRLAHSVIAEYRAAGVNVQVFSVGRKMDEVLHHEGYPSDEDYSRLSAKPTYREASSLAGKLIDGFLSGRYDRVELIYNHFKSTACQLPLRETYLPLQANQVMEESGEATETEYIFEPDRASLIEILLPKTLLLKIYTVILDACAAEHAARTVAMQIATDNGNVLLGDLTLQYNKGRQQKITSEILDIVGGTL